MASVTIHSDFGAQENKMCHCFHCFPIYLPWSDRTGCHGVSFLNVEKQQWSFSLSSFTLIKRLFSSGSLSAIRVMLSVYLRLLIVLLAILIPACDSSRMTFCMMCPSFNLNKQGENIQPWCTFFPIWNQSIVSYPFLTLASWPAYVVSQEAGQVVWYSHLFQNFPVCCDPHS